MKCRWASIKAFLGSWRKGSPPSEVPLPVDKLKCHMQPGGEAVAGSSSHTACWAL